VNECEEYMKLALEEAELAARAGDIPVGAVIVKDGRVVGRGRNTTESDRDPTCHAEINAIRAAARELGGWRLFGCDMYVTLEPCSMCAGAIVLARISKLYIAAEDPKSGACISLSNITTDERLNHRVELHAGLLREESSSILKSFFKELRKRPKKNLEEIEK
jgi:tRNA(adenine34) deaminase